MIFGLKEVLFAGLILSIYGYYVKKRKYNDKKYTPFCDINKNISCTKALSSKYSQMFPISNPLIGVIFYLLAILLLSSSFAYLIFYMAIVSVLMTIYLAYISFFIQKNYCLVCIAIYIINIIILFLSHSYV